MAIFFKLDGQSDYAVIHQLQADLVAARAAGEIPDVVLLLEHAEVITVGRKRDAEGNVLVPGGVPVVAVERGGDVTWHGPGQLVAYPIIQLEGAKMDLHLHMRNLEDAVIYTLGDLGLTGVRDDRNTGVWMPMDGGWPRKVCSVGIACRRWVTWHGLALNLSPDLDAYRRIRPCGFESDVMTRVADHLDPCPKMDAVAPVLARWLAQTLEIDMDGPLRAVSDPSTLLSGLRERST
jgi:lipoyl(octanoyl) transferase